MSDYIFFMDSLVSWLWTEMVPGCQLKMGKSIFYTSGSFTSETIEEFFNITERISVKNNNSLLLVSIKLHVLVTLTDHHKA
jgi:hypothetical protein